MTVLIIMQRVMRPKTPKKWFESEFETFYVIFTRRLPRLFTRSNVFQDQIQDHKRKKSLETKAEWQNVLSFTQSKPFKPNFTLVKSA